jgi:hypothetical protein
LGAAGGRRVGGSIQGRQRVRISGGGRKGEMSRLDLGLLDDAGQDAVHRSTPRLADVGVRAGGEERMREVHPITDQLDDVAGLQRLEKVGHPFDTVAGGATDQFDRGRRGTRRGQQDGADLVVVLTDAATHQGRQTAGQLDCARGGIRADGTGKFDRKERVALGDLVDPLDRGAR